MLFPNFSYVRDVPFAKVKQEIIFRRDEIKDMLISIFLNFILKLSLKHAYHLLFEVSNMTSCYASGNVLWLEEVVSRLTNARSALRRWNLKTPPATAQFGFLFKETSARELRWCQLFSFHDKIFSRPHENEKLSFQDHLVWRELLISSVSNSPRKQHLQFSSRTWSARAPWNCGKFVCQPETFFFSQILLFFLNSECKRYFK